MPALTLDGLASAAALPASVNALLDAYGDQLAQQAVGKSRTDSVAIADLLGLVVGGNDGMVANERLVG